MERPSAYRDTRALDPGRHHFTDVVVNGIASGGGLYVPDQLPAFGLADILALTEHPYSERASRVFERFGVDLEQARIREIMADAYGAQWDDARIAPVEEVVAGVCVLELWHGPTSAFKDLALQCMPRFFSEAIAMKQSRGELAEDYLILVATSGDTGKAALEGFADRAHMGIVVFYPAEGVSELQRAQMVTQRGENVGVFGVEGNFDDCQAAVKEAFGDAEFAALLRGAHGLRLSSANSINWGRLLPQVVYYASAYADMVGAGAVKPGHPVDVCVPTGNFGNILAGYYAKEIGVPIGRLLCAANENNVLADFIATGEYDVSYRTFVTTPSPSMDILVSSNLERLLFHLADAERVSGWMGELASKRRFKVDRETFKGLRAVFLGDWVTNDDSLATIRRVWDEHSYLLDPHTAVAWEVAERLQGDNPVLVVATAHWAKFGQDVYRALAGIPDGGALPADAAALSGVELLERTSELARGCAPIPPALASLEQETPRFFDVVPSGREAVEAAVLGWARAR